MSTSEFVLLSRRVATADGVEPAWLRVKGGRIAAIGKGSPPAGMRVVDVGERAVLPGLVDLRVRVHQPVDADRGAFGAATAEAAASGVTTILDMPFDAASPTASADAFGRKLETAAGRCRVHVGFWGALVPGNASELAHLAAAGVFGFQCALGDAGSPELGPLPKKELAAAMAELARLDALLVVRSEDVERESTARILGLCRQTRARVHFLLRSPWALEQIESARAEGLPVTAETCPRDLALDGGDDGNRGRLWHALASGALDMIGADPSSLGLALPVVWAEARRRGHSLADLSRWMSAAPARLARLEGWKGALAPGRDADFFVFDPEAEWTVDAEPTRRSRRLSPYAGRPVAGSVEATFVQGKKVYERGADTGPPAGELLLSS